MSKMALPSSKYYYEIDKKNPKFEEKYNDFQQFRCLEFGSIKVMIGSFVKLKNVARIKAPGDLDLSPPEFGQVYRIIKTRKGPIIHVFFFNIYSEELSQVRRVFPRNEGARDYPPLTDHDVILDRRLPVKHGVIRRENIASVESLVKIHYQDDPDKLRRLSNTKYCFRFDLTYSKGFTLLVPRVVKTNLKEETYSEEKLAMQLVEEQMAVVHGSVTDAEEVASGPQKPEVLNKVIPGPSASKTQRNGAKLVHDHPALDKPKKIKLRKPSTEEDSALLDDIVLEGTRNKEIKKVPLRKLREKEQAQSKVLNFNPERKSARNGVSQEEKEEEDTPEFGTSKRESQRVKNAAILQQKTKSVEEAKELFEFDEGGGQDPKHKSDSSDEDNVLFNTPKKHVTAINPQSQSKSLVSEDDDDSDNILFNTPNKMKLATTVTNKRKAVPDSEKKHPKRMRIQDAKADGDENTSDKKRRSNIKLSDSNNEVPMKKQDQKSKSKGASDKVDSKKKNAISLGSESKDSVEEQVQKKPPRERRRREIYKILSTDESDSDQGANTSKTQTSRNVNFESSISRLKLAREKEGTELPRHSTRLGGNGSGENEPTAINEASLTPSLETAMNKKLQSTTQIIIPVIRPEGAPIGSAVKVKVPKSISDEEFQTPPTSPQNHQQPDGASQHNSSLLENAFSQPFQSLKNLFMEKKKEFNKVVNFPMDSLDDYSQLPDAEEINEKDEELNSEKTACKEACELEEGNALNPQSRLAIRAKLANAYRKDMDGDEFLKHTGSALDSGTDTKDPDEGKIIEQLDSGDLCKAKNVSQNDKKSSSDEDSEEENIVSRPTKRLTRRASYAVDFRNEFNIEDFLKMSERLSSVKRVSNEQVDLLRAGSEDESPAMPVDSTEIPFDEEMSTVAPMREPTHKDLQIKLMDIDNSEVTASEVEDSDVESTKVIPIILQSKKANRSADVKAIPSPNSLSAPGKQSRKEKLIPKAIDDMRINGRIVKKLVASPAKDGSLKMRIRSPVKITLQSLKGKLNEVLSGTLNENTSSSSFIEIPLNSPVTQDTKSTKRTRKRGRPSKSALDTPSLNQNEAVCLDVQSPPGQKSPKPSDKSLKQGKSSENSSPITPRRRGRPPKAASKTPVVKSTSESASSTLENKLASTVESPSKSVLSITPQRKVASQPDESQPSPGTPRRRGRPPKKTVASSSPLKRKSILAPSKNESPAMSETPKSGRRGRPPKNLKQSTTSKSSRRMSLQLATRKSALTKRRLSVAAQLETISPEKSISDACSTLTRSGRKMVSPRRYKEYESSDEDEASPVVPKKRGRSAFKTTVETPKLRGRGRPQSTTATSRGSTATPKRKKLATEKSDIEEQKMPGREDQMANIQDFIESRLEDQTGGCMYISGLPGTGKTASVNQVLLNLLKQRDSGEIDFKLLQVSGMELTQPQQIFCRMAEILLESKMTPAIAQTSLAKYFSNKDKKRLPTILVVDELDMLCTRKQDVVYHLFDWPTKGSSKLIVLTIANTMDLPERLLQGKVTSRMGLTRLTFRPYTYEQLEKIVQVKLDESGEFDSDARQLVARKVASLSGDARRALEICRRALELADNASVQMSHVMQALKEMLETPTVEAIKNLGLLEKLFLNCMASEIQRTGVEETTLGEVVKSMKSNGLFHGVADVADSKVSEICARLASCRLVLAEQDRGGLRQRISLNVSPDDLHYALKVSNQI